MPPYFVMTASTFGIAAAATLAVRRLSNRQGWLAMPRADRSHQRPTALFGGTAIFLAFTVGLITLGPLGGRFQWLLALTTGMFALGLADDIWELRPQTKLVAEIGVGLLLYLVGFHFNSALPPLLDLAIVVFWVVAITNAMNLLDNMDGLCAGTAAIAVVFRFLFFLKGGNLEGAAVSAIVLGAILGFLVFNFPRASIFMGDAGSLVIGFVLAALNLTSGEAYSKGLFAVLFFPVMVLAIPIFDTAFVLVVRVLSGRAVSLGGRDHTSHRLVAVGLSETAAVLVLHGVSLAGGTAAFVFYQVGFSYAWFVGALLVLALLLFGIFLANVKVYPEDHVPADAPGTGRFSLVANVTYKRVMLWVVIDTLTILVAWYLAFLLRYGETPDWLREVARFTASAPIIIGGVLVGLYACGLYRTDWQRLSLHELWAVASGSALGLGLAAIALMLVGDDVWRRAGLVAAALGANILLLAGSRLFVRALADLPARGAQGAERILIYGAGMGGELTLRELRSNPALAKVAVGFIDDDPGRRGMTLHGVPVVGGVDQVESAIRDLRVQAILVSTRKLLPERETRLSATAALHGVRLYRLDVAVVAFDAEQVAAAGQAEELGEYEVRSTRYEVRGTK